MIESSKNAARRKHAPTVRKAISQHKAVVFWAAFFCIPNMIIGYDPTILGTLVGIPEFRKRFGYEYPAGSGSFALEASWTSAFNYAPVVGFMLVAFWGGWCVDRFGPRKTLLGATVLSLGTLLIEVFGEIAAVIFVGDIRCGVLRSTYLFDLHHGQSPL
jgi:MFS family permease